MHSVETVHAPPARSVPWDAEALQEAYLGQVYAYVSRRLPTKEDAEDATAETFGAAFQGLSKLGQADPRCWLLGIARRKVADALRRRSRRRELPLTDEVVVVCEDPARREQVEELRRIVLGLPEDQREALLLQYLEELSIYEISVVMGRSPTSVNSLLQRARAGLYRAGKDYFLEEIER